jgi:crotonobetainyl-CoA:carnitine CoA-transferase CaiB-like acyl-CoA transferase
VLHPGTRGTKIWANVVDVLGRDDFLNEDGYEPGTPERAARRREIIEALDSWIGARPRDEVIETFGKRSITIAPAYSINDAMHDPQLLERNMFVDVDDAELGRLQLVAPAPRLSETPGRIDHAGPMLGEHTDEVLASIGMSPDEISALRAEGVI